jgi:hypothetical protein
MLQAVLVRRDSAEALEGPDEMAVVAEPDRLRDSGDEAGRVVEHLPCGVDASKKDVIHRRHLEEPFKAAPELTAGATGQPHQILDGDLFGVTGVDEGGSMPQGR